MQAKSPNLNLQQQYSDRAYQLLDKALRSEENGQQAEAIGFYRQALAELKAKFLVANRFFFRAQAGVLHAKMLGRLEMTQNRLAELEAKKSASTPAPSSGGLLDRLYNGLSKLVLGPSNPEPVSYYPPPNPLARSTSPTHSRGNASTAIAVPVANWGQSGLATQAKAPTFPSADRNSSAPAALGPSRGSAAQPTDSSRLPPEPAFQFPSPSPPSPREVRPPTPPPGSMPPPTAPIKKSVKSTPAGAAKNAAPQPQSPADKQIMSQLQSIDKRLRDLIMNEIIEQDTGVEWEQVVGMDEAKRTLEETVIYPMLRPDIFNGLRAPPRGVLLFGPPGNGKTLIAKALARRSKARFFNISAATMTSKWVGESEKLVKALFLIARYIQPSVIFIDEIDSLLTARAADELESSRRLKTEFLVQVDGCSTSETDQILLLGATNRPWDIDSAALRRMVRRIYIPLPEKEARGQIIKNLLAKDKFVLSSSDLNFILRETTSFSFAEMKALCAEAAMGPIRSLSGAQLLNIDAQHLRPITAQDFKLALTKIRAIATPQVLKEFETWSQQFGSS